MTSPAILLKAWGIHPRKSMGQHFLADPAVASAIVEKGGFSSGDTVIEIGAGLGALTIPLAAVAGHVFAVEPDDRIAGLLRNELLAAGAANVTIVVKDILACEIAPLVGGSRVPVRVAGNLPYHISSAVLLYLVERRSVVRSALLMFQKEVAERLLAGPGSKAYGRLTVLVQYSGAVEHITEVPAGAFWPRPQVDSTVVVIRFFDPPPYPAGDEGFFSRLVRAAFGKRRKMLKNALLKSDLRVEPSQILCACQQAGIDPKTRAETLGVKDLVRLSDALRESL
ncbi:MAG: ribosomal RNA small subunit methyltransferase A [Deltaproteobacteria bacterium]|nr:ribosomal RNA small subunit methyltransferase A [Deltaproteobacteria bacterium]